MPLTAAVPLVTYGLPFCDLNLLWHKLFAVYLIFWREMKVTLDDAKFDLVYVFL